MGQSGKQESWCSESQGTAGSQRCEVGTVRVGTVTENTAEIPHRQSVFQERGPMGQGLGSHADQYERGGRVCRGHREGTGRRAGEQAGRAGTMDANTESASSRKWSFLSNVNARSSRGELNVAPG